MLIRSFRPDEINYVIEVHMDFYGTTYGFDETFRSYVGDAINEFLKSFDVEKENLWIVEDGGKPAGSIAIVKVDEATAQLRWFILEEHVRGTGLGRALMTIAVDFCKKNGYHQIYLWTVDQLDAARHLYRDFGFTVTEKAEHKIWGQSLVEERWDLLL